MTEAARSNTRFFYYGLWEGTHVTLEMASEGACPEGHAIEVLHHLGDKGEHYRLYRKIG